MLYLDGIGISFLIKEIKEKILRYKLTKIFQYDRVSFSLFFGKNNLIFQVKDNSTIFYLKDEKDPNTDFQSKFLLSLKKYLQNSILILEYLAFVINLKYPDGAIRKSLKKLCRNKTDEEAQKLGFKDFEIIKNLKI